MRIINSIKERIYLSIKKKLKAMVEPIISQTIAKEVDRELEIRRQQKEYSTAPEKCKASHWERQFDAEKLAKRFEKAGVEVLEKNIDVDDFKKWSSEYTSLFDFYAEAGDVHIEKVLEHYLTMRYLDVKQTDVLVDVAAAGSPFAKTLRQKGWKTYRQDLTYPAGINGYAIGGDAGNMPVPVNFADVLTLHCAFECFQGDADVRFARETNRILKTGGRVGIVPLYVDTVHFVKTSPYCDKRNIHVEADAEWLWRDDQYREPFSRHYSPEVFVEKVASQMPMLDKSILYFVNLDSLSGHFEGQRIYCHFMFRGVKNGPRH